MTIAAGRLAALLAAWLVGCGPSPPTDAGSRMLEVHHRVFRSAATDGSVRAPLPALDAVGDCDVGGEIRPALGCPTFIREWRWRGEDSIDGRRLTLDRHVAARPVIVERAFRRRAKDPWTPLPLVRLGRGARRPLVSFDVPPQSQTRAIVYVPMPTTAMRQTDPVEIPPAAVLQGGIGLHALGGRGEVRFRIVAAVDGRRRTVLDETIAGRSTRWKDYRIDLTDLAGRTAVLRFVTSGVGTARLGAPLPLWSRPLVVAPAATPTMPNVIVVSLDTLRGDYVGASGRGRVETPALDALATEGAYFTDAMAPYPSTTASHMSLFTALYPSVHEVTDPGRVLPRAVRTLAEMLADARFATAAVTEDGMLLARSGFQRGFDSYREFKEALATMTSGHIEQVMGAGLAWVDAHRDERFFLFLHTYQVHAPYAPPPSFSRHRDSDAASPFRFEDDRSAYADEVEYADHVVGGFVQALDERGLREQTIVVVVSDHGEAFGEHGLVLHGSWVHDPQVRVPMIFRAPRRIPAGVRSEVPVSLVDVTPTILDLLGIPTPPAVQGRSLVPILEGRAADELRARPVFAEHGGGSKYTIAARRGTTKWIVDAKGSARVFDLRTDPGESSARTAPAAGEPGAEMVARFKAESDRLRAIVRPEVAPKAPPVDPDAEGRLRALGYLE